MSDNSSTPSLLDAMARGALDGITAEAVGRLILGGIANLVEYGRTDDADAVLTLCRAHAALSGRPEMTDAEMWRALGPFINAALAEENARLREELDRSKVTS